MAKASARLQVHPTSVTNAVDRLEKAELVRRVPHPSDRRATLIEISDAGRALALEATEMLNSKVFAHPGLQQDKPEIGRASCRERVCKDVSFSGVAVSSKNKQERKHKQ